MTEMSKRYKGKLWPPLRPRLPLMSWKSTGFPEKLSTGPSPLAPGGASNDVRNAAQFERPAAWHAATPDWPTTRFVPASDAILVATSVPAGTPAQPTRVEPARQIFGRWFVSDPMAGKAEPANAPSPVETGNGRPDCSELRRLNVQLLMTFLRNGVPRRLSVSITTVKFPTWRISFCANDRASPRPATRV